MRMTFPREDRVECSFYMDSVVGREIVTGGVCIADSVPTQAQQQGLNGPPRLKTVFSETPWFYDAPFGLALTAAFAAAIRGGRGRWAIRGR